MYVCMYVRTYVCVCVCMYVYVCILVGMLCLYKVCPYLCSYLEYLFILGRYIGCIAGNVSRIVDLVARGSGELSLLSGCLTYCRIVAP
jgi:hypothetical protein